MNVLTFDVTDVLIFANLVAVDAVSLKSYLQFPESYEVQHLFMC